MYPHRHTTLLSALGVALCLIAPRIGQAQQRQFTIIDVPGAPNTIVTSLNNKGQVVGSYDNGAVTKSFVWSNGTFTDLAVPSSVFICNANAINDKGQIVGLEVSDTFTQGGFFYDHGDFTPFDNPNAVFGLTFPHAINKQGQIAGFFVDSDFNTTGFVYSRGAFKTVKVPFTGAVITAINAINDDGQIAGYYGASLPNGSFVTKAFITVKGKFTALDVPDATVFSVATGINKQGKVVGYYQGLDSSTHGFLYDNGHYTLIDAPGTGVQNTYPGGINDKGQISGEYVDSSSVIHGFLLSDSKNSGHGQGGDDGDDDDDD